MLFRGTKTKNCHKFNVPEVKSLMDFKCEQEQSHKANHLKNINN